MARGWPSRARALSEVHTPCLATIHLTGLQLTTGTTQSPNWGLSWDTAQALMGSAGNAQHGLHKSRWKFSVDFWGNYDFLLILLDSLLVYTGELGEVRKIYWRKEAWNISAGEWQVTPCTWMELNREQWEVFQIFRHHRQGFTEITVLSWKPGNSSRRRCGLGQCMWAKNFASDSATLKIWLEN